MRKLRYLHALGIERWVPRSAGRPSPSAPAPDAVMTREVLSAEPVLASAPAAVADTATRAPQPAGSPPAETAGTTQVAAPAVPRVPRFRLVVLQLASSMLLIDEGLLGTPGRQAERKLLLGDVLRTATLLQSGEAGGTIDSHVFYWPQVDDASFDQGLPRAREALAYHVRQRAQAGCVLLVKPTAGSSESAGDLARVLEGLEALSVPLVELDAAGLVDDEPSARAAVWDTLQQLWRPG